MRVFSRRHISAASRLGFVTVSVVATACSPAFAQHQVTWGCSAQNGVYSENPQSISPSARTLTGRIQFQSGEFGERWNPVAHIAFTDTRLPTNADCFCNGIRASIYPAEPDIVKFFMTFNGQSVGIAQGPVGKPITFKLSIDDAGVLTAVIGKTNPVVKTAKLRHAQRNKVHMSCSSGNVSFLDVRAE